MKKKNSSTSGRLYDGEVRTASNYRTPMILESRSELSYAAQRLPTTLEIPDTSFDDRAFSDVDPLGYITPRGTRRGR